MKINYHESPSIHINICGGIATDAEGNDSVIACGIDESSVHIRGDWPRGVDIGGMRSAIVAAINSHLSKEGGAS